VTMRPFSGMRTARSKRQETKSKATRAGAHCDMHVSSVSARAPSGCVAAAYARSSALQHARASGSSCTRATARPDASGRGAKRGPAVASHASMGPSSACSDRSSCACVAAAAPWKPGGAARGCVGRKGTGGRGECEGGRVKEPVEPRPEPKLSSGDAVTGVAATEGFGRPSDGACAPAAPLSPGTLPPVPAAAAPASCTLVRSV
jgi:hypothetical protein